MSRFNTKSEWPGSSSLEFLYCSCSIKTKPQKIKSDCLVPCARKYTREAGRFVRPPVPLHPGGGRTTWLQPQRRPYLCPLEDFLLCPVQTPATPAPLLRLLPSEPREGERAHERTFPPPPQSPPLLPPPSALPPLAHRVVPTQTAAIGHVTAYKLHVPISITPIASSLEPYWETCVQILGTTFA